jgi:aryl-alcohol dehydrogenase-like predicted oxidoreductase
MQTRMLGQTGFLVSVIAFGCGPVSGWMAELDPESQCHVIRHAIDQGINWFDTAAAYGDGKSEASLGQALARLGHPKEIHIATKVRYLAENLGNIRDCTHASLEASLRRLGVNHVSLLQLHNSVTASRGDEPNSITLQDVLGKGGVAEAFRELQAEGVVKHIGITGIGQPAALREVIRSGAFATMQVPYNLLNPSAGQFIPTDFPETDYGNIIAACAGQNVGVFAIRVFAGGALLGRPPSPHTLKTPFFPLSLYKRDSDRASALADTLPSGHSLQTAAVRFALAHPSITSAIVGFRTPAEVDAAVAAVTGDQVADR